MADTSGGLTSRSLARAVSAALGTALLAGCAAASSSASSSPAAGGCRHQQQAGGDTVVLTTSSCPPHGGGSTDLVITVRDSAGHAVTGATVTVQTAMPSMGMSGDKVTTVSQGDSYRAHVLLGMSGGWTLTVTISPPAGSPVTARFDVQAS